jgi:uncharacterized protein (TIGR02145 family)
LYTWYAVDRNSNGDKNVCPEGWHVPTRGEWKALVRHLGGEAKAGAELKEAGWEHWREMNYDATNKSGFTALPAGERADYKNNNFISLGYHTCFWSQNKYDDKEAYILSLDNNSSNAYVTDYPMQWGLSIRCLKN